MTHKKQLALLTTGLVLIMVVIILDGFFENYVYGNCLELYGSLLGCLDTILFGFKYQVFSLLTLSLLLSIIPLFFLGEMVYKAWQKFAVVAIPVVAILIFLAPTHSPGPFYYLGYDREVASILFSVLFLLVSWGITAHVVLKK